MQMTGDRKATKGWGNHNESFFSWETRGKGSAFLRVLYGQRFSDVVLTAAASTAPGNWMKMLLGFNPNSNDSATLGKGSDH